jgi:imidazolonepropionase-like amidohydrolase
VSRLALTQATLFDSAAGVLRPGTTIVIEGARIAHVTQEPIAVDDAQTIDCAGRVVLPGLIDAHVHVTLGEPAPTDELFHHREPASAA